jgi:hypothetical protein
VSKAKSIRDGIIPVDILTVRFKKRLTCDTRTWTVESIESAMNDFRELTKGFVDTANV